MTMIGGAVRMWWEYVTDAGDNDDDDDDDDNADDQIWSELIWDMDNLEI